MSRPACRTGLHEEQIQSVWQLPPGIYLDRLSQGGLHATQTSSRELDVEAKRGGLSTDVGSHLPQTHLQHRRPMSRRRALDRAGLGWAGPDWATHLPWGYLLLVLLVLVLCRCWSRSSIPTTFRRAGRLHPARAKRYKPILPLRIQPHQPSAQMPRQAR